MFLKHHRIERINVFVRSIYHFLVFGWFFNEIYWDSCVFSNVYIQQRSKVKLGKGIKIRSYSSISGSNFILGDNSKLGYGCHVFGNVSIGKNVMVAPNAVFASDYHGVSIGASMMYQKGTSKGPIFVGDDVWIGANCVILSGVTIGGGSVVGAGSVVTKSVETNIIVAGNPASVIGKRE